MVTISDHRAVTADSLTGQLLVASPALTDSTFDRAVVLLVDHDEAGALGVVLNRPSPMDVAAVLPDWHEYAAAPNVVFHGGPVARDSALALAALLPGVSSSEADEPLGFRRVFRRLGLVDLDAPPEVIAAEISTVRVFAGYAGWAADQLEAEIEEGSWFVVDSTPDDPFRVDAEHLWRDVLRRQGGQLALVSTFPADPTMN